MLVWTRAKFYVWGFVADAYLTVLFSAERRSKGRFTPVRKWEAPVTIGLGLNAVQAD